MVHELLLLQKSREKFSLYQEAVWRAQSPLYLKAYPRPINLAVVELNSAVDIFKIFLVPLEIYI
jgi:hypothetical protein